MKPLKSRSTEPKLQKREDIPRVGCPVEGCTIPQGISKKGFSKAGLSQHMGRVHKAQEAITAEAIVAGIFDDVRPIDDIKKLLDPNNESVPVEPYDHGVRVEVRDGQLYIDNVAANTDQFIAGLRIAIKVTR